jgi:hypothetical protein
MQSIHATSWSVQVLHLFTQRTLSSLQHPASWMMGVVSTVERTWQTHGPQSSNVTLEQRRWEEHKQYAVNLITTSPAMLPLMAFRYVLQPQHHAMTCHLQALD